MKPFLYSLLFLFSFSFTSAQNFPFPTDEAVWDIHYDGPWFNNTIYSDFDYKYEMIGDTLIDGEIYGKLHFRRIYEIIRNPFNQTSDTVFFNETPQIIGGIWEDPATRKVYFRYFPNNSWPANDVCVASLTFPDHNLLIYDFGMEVGDTIYFELFNNFPEWVEEINLYQFEDGTMRKTQTLTNEYGNHDENMSNTEGMGSYAGPLGFYHGGSFESGCLLRCFAESNYLVWGNCDEYDPVHTGEKDQKKR